MYDGKDTDFSGMYLDHEEVSLRNRFYTVAGKECNYRL